MTKTKAPVPPQEDTPSPGDDGGAPVTSFGLHPLHQDEEATIEAMRRSARRVRLLPTHCINENAELEGFGACFDGALPGTVLPVNRSMFMGHSLFEVTPRHGALVNSDVVRLMQNAEGRNAEVLAGLMRDIEARSIGREANFDCAPDNLDSVVGLNGSGTHVVRAMGKRAVDSSRWVPEVPHITGLYHAMVRGFQKDVRQHKLFIGVSGGCPKCCDAYYNLMLDVGSEWTCMQVAESEETWWLRKACQRARCMVAKSVADAFGLRIQTCKDVHGHDDDVLIGVPTVDTLEFDLTHSDDTGLVTLLNGACDTTVVQNGILCHMHPSEGFWLFKGSPRSSSRGACFGAMFGSAEACGVFPTRAPCYRPGLGSPSFVRGLDTALVTRLHTAPRAVQGTSTVYQCFDEAFMRNLERMGWNRDHGVVELMPLAVCVT